jgi:hypothetical protein
MSEVLWRGRCRSRWALPIAIAAAVGAVLMVVLGVAPLALIFVALALAMLPFIGITVTVEPQGLRVRYLGGVKQLIPLERIESVDATNIVPARWGGWGYRGSLRVLKVAAVVLRKGDGLVLNLRGGKRFAVTVDHAVDGANALDSLLQTR